MLSVLLLALGASALQPSPDQFIGVEPERIRRYHVATQHRLRASTEWHTFTSSMVQGLGSYFQLVWIARWSYVH